MSTNRKYQTISDALTNAGLRPTAQRLRIAEILFGHDMKKHQHITADQLFDQVKTTGTKLSLATIYNTLNCFKNSGLLKEMSLDSDQVYYDTNISDHHHFYVAETGAIIDIDDETLKLAQLPNIPTGKKVKSVEVVVHLENA